METRATAEAIAIDKRREAERIVNLAIARELASLALANIVADPEGSILLALESLDTTYSLEGEEALRQALPASRVRLMLASDHEHEWVRYIGKVISYSEILIYTDQECPN